MRSVRSLGVEDTRRLGRCLGRLLLPPRSVLMFGDLGAGKTVLAKGLCEGLGVGPELVHSPTYSLINQYSRDGGEVFHVDLYRLDHKRDQVSIGLEELLDQEIVLVEWADKLKLSCGTAIRVVIRPGSDDLRMIDVEGLSVDELRSLDRSLAGQE